jgi:DoxX-like family
MTPRTNRIIYWISTLLFVLPQVWSAFLMLSRAPRMVDTITSGLGYPSYFLTILGFSKLLGAAAILSIHGWSRVKEWAYAGFTFEVLGAFLSHLAAGDTLLIASVPLTFLAMQATSYSMWKKLAPLPENKVPSLAPSGRPSLGRWPYSERESIRLRGHA